MTERPPRPDRTTLQNRRTLVDTIVNTLTVQRERGTAIDVQAGTLGRVSLLRGTAHPLILHPRLPVTVTILDYQPAPGVRRATVVHQDDLVRIIPVVLEPFEANIFALSENPGAANSDLKLAHHISSVYYSRQETIDTREQLFASPATFGIYEDIWRDSND
ncbi:MAG TPA: hypothetical protein VK978_02025 [Candidatus Saccharimonadales bacterium]|nr:hypothetical protein [Candidatus Saccharimonadales bacterium]